MSAQSQAHLPISPRRPLTSRTGAALRRPWPVGIPGAGNVAPAQLREVETLLKQGPGRTARDWQDLTKISLRKRPPRCLWRNRPESLATHLLKAGGARGLPCKESTYLCDNRTNGSNGKREGQHPPVRKMARHGNSQSDFKRCFIGTVPGWYRKNQPFV